MRLPSLQVLSLVLLISEVALGLRKRAGGASGRDRFTLPLLWLVILLSLWVGVILRSRAPGGQMPYARFCYLAGFSLFTIGIVVRWVAIFYLGRFFTVNVAIAGDHELITSGPYRFVRHPSYSGSFLIFLGLGFCTLNFYSLLVIMLPITAAFLWRIQVEESALRSAFPGQYETYAARTARVLPGVY